MRDHLIEKVREEKGTAKAYYHKYRLYTIRGIISRWAPESENNTRAYIENVSRLTGIDPDEPIGIPMECPARWMMVGVAMAIQENGTSSLDYFPCFEDGNF